jgi:hypothetical protein
MPRRWRGMRAPDAGARRLMDAEIEWEHSREEDPVAGPYARGITGIGRRDSIVWNADRRLWPVRV